MSAPDRPPLRFWLIPTGVAALRMLPVLSLSWWPAPAGQTFLGISYLRKDFLQYATFVRQAAAEGSLLLYDPFTTEPQSPRFVLLFHWAVGVVARIAGLPAVQALEWSRVPLLFAFFATFWWFLRPFLPERRDRACAAVLVGFASGFESWLRPLASHLPAAARDRFLADTWSAHGWSAFASFQNPLWIASLGVALIVLRPLLIGGGRTIRARVGTCAALLVLYGIHPYTTIGVLGIAGIQPFVTWLARACPDWRRHFGDAAALGVALLGIGALNLWQMQEPVYRAAAGGIFGGQNLSVLWYPLTLGGLGVMAAVGARRWLATRHPHRHAIFGWILAIAGLHWLPILNGYKFVFLLPLPVCILAAPVAREVFARGRWPAAAAGVALFGGVVFHTVADVRTTRSVSAVPSDLMRVVETLSERSAGHVLAPPLLGNVLPAFTLHRVWVGHWFLTPDYPARREAYGRLTSNPKAAPALRALVQEQQIRFVVVPAVRTPIVQEGLGAAVAQRLPHGDLDLLILH